MLAFLVVRNEMARLPQMLEHHRNLGVERFFVVDNGSTDGTADLLLASHDVHVFATSESYQAAGLGIDWLHALLGTYGDNRWCLILDADERLAYVSSDVWTLPRLCERLRNRGLNCLATMFIDLYGPGPLADSAPQRGRDLLEICNLFDSAGYDNVPQPNSRVPRIYGGVRARLFWPEVDLRAFRARTQRLAAAAFEEDAYLRCHRDVQQAVASRRLASGLAHFLVHGHREGRQVSVRPVEGWREAEYLAANPDVASAVERGEFSNGLEHYVRYGQFELRLPTSDWPPCLTQIPLLWWQEGMRLHPGRHGVEGACWRRADVVGGALLHFKLMADAAARARDVIGRAGSSRATPWRSENERYADALAREPRLSAATWRSRRYRGAEQLARLGLITAPEDC